MPLRDHRGPPRPRTARPSVVDSAGGVARRPSGRSPPRHLPARRALRAAVGPGAGRQGDQGRPRPPRVRHAAQPRPPGRALRRAVRRRHRPGHGRRRAARRRASSPGTCSSRCPTARCFSQNLRPDTAARLIDALAVLLVRLHLDRLLVGRRLAVQHAVPPRRGRLRRLPRRRRDRRAARSPVRRAARARPRHRARQHRRRADGPRRPAACSRSTPTRSTCRRSIVERYHTLWDELTGTESLRVRRPLAGRRAHPPAQRARLRRRRAGDHHRHRRHRRSQIQPKVVDAGHHSRRLLRLTGSRRRGEPGPSPAQRPRLLPAATDRQGEDEEIVAHDWLAQVFEPVVRRRAPRAARQARAGRGLPRGARAPLVHDRAGRPRRPDRRGGARLRRRRCCRPSPTRRPCSASTPRRCPSSACSTDDAVCRPARSRRRVGTVAGRLSRPSRRSPDGGPERIWPKRTTIHSTKVMTWTAVHHRQIALMR